MFKIKKTPKKDDFGFPVLNVVLNRYSIDREMMFSLIFLWSND